MRKRTGFLLHETGTEYANLPAEEDQTVRNSLRYIDNHDSRIPYYELMLEQGLADIPELDLPKGYHYENFKPGDRAAWISVEKSAKEFASDEEGEEAWQRYYAGREKELETRMFFVVDESGQKLATATAFYDIRTGDNGQTGWLHWVAVRRDAQGKGLSKPLITHTLQYMKKQGYSRAVIPTQTTTWLACKVYLDLGFRPIPQNAERNRTGWEIVKTLTNHPALEKYERRDIRKILGMDTVFFPNAYFIIGTAYAGKSTMVKLLAEKHGGIACEENYHDRLIGELDTEEFPCLTYTRDLQDWHDFIRRTPKEYKAWTDGVQKECETLELRMLPAICAQGKPVFVDTNISPETLHLITPHDHVLVMLADPGVSVRRFFDRTDPEKQFLYQLIMEEDDPEEAMENYRQGLMLINSQEAYERFLNSGYHVILRDENRTIDQTLALAEKALGLEASGVHRKKLDVKEYT